jgi:polysaccharide biosynthesis transport protein
VLTSGPATEAASNLLYSPRLPEILRALKNQYEMVLIDTPPMLSMSDSRLVGRLADAVILVIRAHQTTRDAAIAAGKHFTEDGTRILGTILNDWNPKLATGYGYGYGYGYYKRYGHYYGREREGD